MARSVSVLITDVDNTLFDWVSVWQSAYSALVGELQRISGVPEDELLEEIREIHQRHGTSEYAFLIEDLDCLGRPGEDRDDRLLRYGPAIEAFESARDAALHLYPGVGETLEELRARGVLLVGYTESLTFYTSYRIRRLGLDGLLRVLYSPPDHALPPRLNGDGTARLPYTRRPLRETTHRHTLPGERKPSPAMLAYIMAAVGGEQATTAYVGDSLLRDVSMAQLAGVSDVLAEYGRPSDQEAYTLLDRLTHWTDDDIARERDFLGRRVVEPSYVLRKSFAELLNLFEFTRFSE